MSKASATHDDISQMLAGSRGGEEAPAPAAKPMKLAKEAPKDDGAPPDPIDVTPDMLKVHACGLPMLFIVSNRGVKMAHKLLTDYVNQYAAVETVKARSETRPGELEAYTEYRRVCGTIKSGMDYFVAARRMWANQKTYPLKPAPRPSIDDIGAAELD